MESGDYYQYRAELREHHTVTFPDRQVLIDYLAETWAKEYEDFCARKLAYCTVAEYESGDHALRLMTEPWGVKMRAKEYLINQFVDADTLWNKFKNLLRCRKLIPEFRYDTAKNAEVFETILRKVSPSDTPSDVFQNDVAYVVSNWTTLSVEEL